MMAAMTGFQVIKEHQETWLVAFCNWQMARSFITQSHETGRAKAKYCFKVYPQIQATLTTEWFRCDTSLRIAIQKNVERTHTLQAFSHQNHHSLPQQNSRYRQIRNQVFQPPSLTPLFVGLILGRRVAIWSIGNCAIPVQGDLWIDCLYGFLSA